MADQAYKISPENYLDDFGYFESWSKGTSVAPDGWVAAGTAGSIARESTNIKYGVYSMKITAGSSGVYAAEYTYDLLTNTVFKKGQEIPALNYFPGRTIKFGVWVKCATASKARVYINDGVTAVTYSSYHTGGNTFEFLEVELQVSESSTIIKFGCETTNNAIVAYFDGATFVEGEIIFTDFRGTNIYVKDQDFLVRVSFSVGSFVVPRRQGVKVQSVFFRERTIRFNVQIHTTALSTSRTIFDSIIKAVTGGRKELWFEDDRVAKVHLSNLPELKFNVDARIYTFELQFISEEASLAYLSRFRDKENVSSSPKSFQVENSGSVVTLPRFYFLPPAGITVSTLTMENLTTGQRFSYSNTISPNATLLVDSYEAKVLAGSIDGMSYYTGDWIELVPGTNFMRATVTAGITIYTDWFDRYV